MRITDRYRRKGLQRLQIEVTQREAEALINAIDIYEEAMSHYSFDTSQVDYFLLKKMFYTLDAG